MPRSWQQRTLTEVGVSRSQDHGPVYSGRDDLVIGAASALGSLTITGDPFNTSPAPPGARIESGIRVQMPSEVINPTQSWIAFRVRMGWASNAAPAQFLRLWHWADDANNEMRTITADGSGGAQTLTLRREVGGVGTSAPSVLATFSAGDSITYIAAWEASRLRAALNGAAFSNANDANIPTLAASSFDLGRDALSATLFINSTFLWIATGTGVLTSADSAALDAFGDTPPTLAQLRATLSGGARPTSAWSAVSSTFEVLADSTVQIATTGLNYSSGGATFAVRPIGGSAGATSDVLWDVRSASDRRMTLAYNRGSQRWEFTRETPDGVATATVSDTFASGTQRRISVAWDAEGINLWVGESGDAEPAPDIPVITAATMDIASSALDGMPVALGAAAFFTGAFTEAEHAYFSALTRVPYAGELVGERMLAVVRGFEVAA